MNNNNVERKRGFRSGFPAESVKRKHWDLAVAILGSIGGSMAACTGGEVEWFLEM
jgi:hypothetical protein